MDFVSKCSLSTVLLHTTRTTVPLSRVARTVALLREVRARVARGTPTPHPACVRLWCSASSQIIGGVFYSPLPLTVNHACGLQINTQYSVYRDKICSRSTVGRSAVILFDRLSHTHTHSLECACVCSRRRRYVTWFFTPSQLGRLYHRETGEGAECLALVAAQTAVYLTGYSDWPVSVNNFATLPMSHRCEKCLVWSLQ